MRIDTSTKVLSELLHARRNILHGLPIGVIQIDEECRIVDANREALEIMGRASVQSVDVADVFADELARKLLGGKWERRQTCAGEYSGRVVRANDAREVPVHFTRVPLVDGKGAPGGSIALMWRGSDRTLRDEIHRLNGSITDNRELLRDVMARVMKEFNADMAVATRYSENLAHAHSFFVLSKTDGNTPMPKGWARLTDVHRASLKRRQAEIIPDLAEFLQKDAAWQRFADDPLVAAMLIGKQKAVLSRRVWRQNKIIGAVSLLSRTQRLFDVADAAHIDALPLDATLVGYIDYQERERSHQRFKLLQSLSKCQTVQAASRILAKSLVRIFGWSHVSVYRVEYSRGVLRLLAQATLDRGLRLARGHTQPIDAGLLGRVVQSRQHVNIGNVNAAPDYVRYFPEVKSELCWPIRWSKDDSRPRLILNVEDRNEDAFSENESDWLGEIANEVGDLIERISTNYFLTQCFNSTSDAIVVTNAKGDIREANPAAAQLLGYADRSALIRVPIASLFVDAAAFQNVVQPEHRTEISCRLLTLNRETPVMPVHVSCQPLPDDLGGAIFVLKDLREIQRGVELDLLGQATYEVAMQTKAPLALAMATLDQAARRLSPEERRALDKALRQLDRVERGYTRLAMFRDRTRAPGDARREHSAAEAQAFGTVDLLAEVRAIAADLQPPAVSQPVVVVKHNLPSPRIRGDQMSVSLLLETLLGALVRFAPEDEPVLVEFAEAGGRLILRLRGHLARRAYATETVRLTRDVRAELRVALPMVEKILAVHGAMLEPPQYEGESRVTYTLSFPAPLEEIAA
jgi:PAS domain S-box-containing protein